MLFGLRFLFGAALACLLMAGLLFALIATSRLTHDSQVSLVAPAPPAPGEIVGPDRQQTSGTGGPYVAPVIVPVPLDSAPAPTSLQSGDIKPADDKNDEVNATGSTSPAPAATESEAEPSVKPAQDQDNASPVKDSKAGEPDKDPGRAAKKAPSPVEKQAKKPASRARTQPRSAATSSAPAAAELPFNYFLK